MNLYIQHGRLDPDGGGTTVDGELTGDWGFDGPTLKGCIGFHTVYFDQGHFNVYFENANAKEAAQALTGWEDWDETGLTVDIRAGCLRLFNKERGRYEYFGDWGLK